MTGDSTPPPRLPARISALLDGIRRRFGLTRPAAPPAPASPERPRAEPFAALLGDLKARLLAYHRAGWAVEVNGLPCRAGDGHPACRGGIWQEQPDGRCLTVTVTLRPAR
jgi:hypothetical protein